MSNYNQTTYSVSNNLGLEYNPNILTGQEKTLVYTNNDTISSGDLSGYSHSQSFSRSTFASNITTNNSMLSSNNENDTVGNDSSSQLQTQQQTQQLQTQEQTFSSQTNNINKNGINSHAIDSTLNESLNSVGLQTNNSNEIHSKPFRISLTTNQNHNALDPNSSYPNNSTPNNTNDTNTNTTNNNNNNANEREESKSQFMIHREPKRLQKGKQKPSTTKPTSHNPMFEIKSNNTANNPNDTNFNNFNNHNGHDIDNNNNNNNNPFHRHNSNLHNSKNTTHENEIDNDNDDPYQPVTRLHRAQSQTQQNNELQDNNGNNKNNSKNTNNSSKQQISRSTRNSAGHSQYLTSLDHNKNEMSRLRSSHTNPSSPTNEAINYETMDKEELISRLKRRHSKIENNSKRAGSIIHSLLANNKDNSKNNNNNNNDTNSTKLMSVDSGASFIPENENISDLHGNLTVEKLFLPKSMINSMDNNNNGMIVKSAPNTAINSRNHSVMNSHSSLPQLETNVILNNNNNENNRVGLNNILNINNETQNDGMQLNSARSVGSSDVEASKSTIEERSRARRERIQKWGQSVDSRMVCFLFEFIFFCFEWFACVSVCLFVCIVCLLVCLLICLKFCVT